MTAQNDKYIKKDLIRDGVLQLSLNREEVCNAMNDAMIEEISIALAQVNSDESIRVVTICGCTDFFSSGIDISWIEQMANTSQRDDVRRLAHLLLQLETLNKPTIALIDGICFGSGVALAACCDIVIASEGSSFALPAVNIGTSPAVIAPFLVKKIGLSHAKRFLLTGERFDAEQARLTGLVHAVTMQAQMQDCCNGFIDKLLLGGPRAISDCKEVLHSIHGQPVDRKMIEDVAKRMAQSRRSQEAKEGLAAYQEKRLPSWAVPSKRKS
ncbi:MAG: enoyl-CoA hydratase-related protein [bacterium]